MNIRDFFEEMWEKIILLPDKLSDGIVEKILMFQCDTVPSGHVCEMAFLHLTVGSAIKRHKHFIDSEVYIILNTGEVLKCEVGNEHELKNNLGEDMYVLSIKKRA